MVGPPNWLGSSLWVKKRSAVTEKPKQCPPAMAASVCAAHCRAAGVRVQESEAVPAHTPSPNSSRIAC